MESIVVLKYYLLMNLTISLIFSVVLFTAIVLDRSIKSIAGMLVGFVPSVTLALLATNTSDVNTSLNLLTYGGICYIIWAWFFAAKISKTKNFKRIEIT